MKYLLIFIFMLLNSSPTAAECTPEQFIAKLKQAKRDILQSATLRKAGDVWEDPYYKLIEEWTAPKSQLPTGNYEDIYNLTLGQFEKNQIAFKKFTTPAGNPAFLLTPSESELGQTVKMLNEKEYKVFYSPYHSRKHGFKAYIHHGQKEVMIDAASITMNKPSLYLEHELIHLKQKIKYSNGLDDEYGILFKDAGNVTYRNILPKDMYEKMNKLFDEMPYENFLTFEELLTYSDTLLKAFRSQNIQYFERGILYQESINRMVNFRMKSLHKYLSELKEPRDLSFYVLKDEDSYKIELEFSNAELIGTYNQLIIDFNNPAMAHIVSNYKANPTEDSFKKIVAFLQRKAHILINKTDSSIKNLEYIRSQVDNGTIRNNPEVIRRLQENYDIANDFRF